jgi:hypothetical protein
MPRMTDDALSSQLEALERQAVGYYGGEIAGEQSKAMDYYYRKPFGTEEEGRSQVISSDVWDVVEGMTPMIAKPFVSSDDVVSFNPVGPDDEEAAQQETDYVNYVVTQKGDIFNELIAAIKTGLLQKVGVAKYWWEKYRRTEIERYEGITDDQFAMIMQADGVEVIEHSETQAAGPDGMPELLHDVVLRVSREEGCAKYAVIPPEEFRISRDARSTNPKHARYVGHVTRKTLSEIREMGFDVPDDVTDYNAEDPSLSPQYLSRRASEEAFHDSVGDVIDPSSREVAFRDSLVRLDYDGDGIAELRRVVMVGREILLNEEAEEVNYVAWTPYPQPFKFYGSCPADETVDIQLIKSTLWRQSLDNIYTINNNRNFVSESVNIDDLLDNQIAGIVRVKGQGPVGNHVQSAQVTPIGGVVQPMIEYLDAAKENRTGFTRYNQGMDANSLNKTATGIRIIAEAGNERMALIARAFAEQFLKPLMIGIHGILRRHATTEETYRIRGKWVAVDPRQWKTRHDMTVSVGLGTSDKQMQLQSQMMILGEQKQAIQAGLATPAHIYRGLAKLVELTGEKSPEKYFQDPSKQEPQAPADPMQDPAMQMQVAEAQRKDKELELKERELDMKANTAHVDSLIKTAELELKVAGVVPLEQLMTQLQGIQQQIQALQGKQTEEILMGDEPLENEPDEMQMPEQMPIEMMGGDDFGQA